jgi:hypothetical protein
LGGFAICTRGAGFWGAAAAALVDLIDLDAGSAEIYGIYGIYGIYEIYGAAPRPVAEADPWPGKWRRRQ